MMDDWVEKRMSDCTSSGSVEDDCEGDDGAASSSVLVLEEHGFEMDGE